MAAARAGAGAAMGSKVQSTRRVTNSHLRRMRFPDSQSNRESTQYKMDTTLRMGNLISTVTTLQSHYLTDGYIAEAAGRIDDNTATPYYQRGGITIYHADSREVITRYPKRTTVTDPPYNIGYHYKQYADRLSTAEYSKLLLTLCQPPCVLLHYPEAIYKFAVDLRVAPDRVVSWVYPSNTPRQHRDIAWFGVRPDFKLCGQPYRNPTDRRVQKLIAAAREAKLYDWWEINQVKNVSAEKTSHPNQIPLEVMRRVIAITPAELIFDPFMGSGTTLLAAQALGRTAVGVELEESACEIAAKRLEANL